MFSLHLNNLESDINEIVNLLQVDDQRFSNRQYEKFQGKVLFFLH